MNHDKKIKLGSTPDKVEQFGRTLIFELTIHDPFSGLLFIPSDFSIRGEQIGLEDGLSQDLEQVNRCPILFYDRNHAEKEFVKNEISHLNGGNGNYGSETPYLHDVLLDNAIAIRLYQVNNYLDNCNNIVNDKNILPKETVDSICEMIRKSFDCEDGLDLDIMSVLMASVLGYEWEELYPATLLNTFQPMLSKLHRLICSGVLSVEMIRPGARAKNKLFIQDADRSEIL